MLFIALFVAVLAVSTSAPLVHAAAPAPALTVAALRVCIAAVLLAAISGRQLRSWWNLGRKDHMLVVAAGLLLAAHFGVWISSLYLTSTAASVALVATQPVFAGLLGWLVLGDRVGHREISAIAIVCIGCAVLAWGDVGRGSAALGDTLAILGALTAASYLIVGRRLRNAVPLMPYLALVNLIAGVALLVAALVAGSPLRGWPGHVYLAIFLCAAVPSLIGHSLLNWSVRRVPAHLVSLAILGEPIGASLLTWAIHGEQPPATAALGGTVILLGVAVGLLGRQRLPSKALARRT